MATKPENPQGIAALYKMRAADWDGWAIRCKLGSYESNLERKKVGSGITVLKLKSEDGQVYVKDQKEFVASVKTYHEAGRHRDDWVIDTDPTQPLFTITVDSDRGHYTNVHIGFQSRGVPGARRAYGPEFPEITGKYEFVSKNGINEVMEFTGIDYPENLKKSLLSGERVKVTTEDRGEQIAIISTAKNGKTEEIILPKMIDFMWPFRLAQVTDTVGDPSQPYMKWQDEIGASFTSR